MRRNAFPCLGSENGSGGAAKTLKSDDDNGKVNGDSDGETTAVMTMMVTKTVTTMTMALTEQIMYDDRRKY